jgi:hypothetical protein
LPVLAPSSVSDVIASKKEKSLLHAFVNFSATVKPKELGGGMEIWMWYPRRQGGNNSYSIKEPKSLEHALHMADYRSLASA